MSWPRLLWDEEESRPHLWAYELRDKGLDRVEVKNKGSGQKERQERKAKKRS